MTDIVYNLEQINVMEFESNDLPDLWPDREPRGSYRLTDSDIAGMPDAVDLDDLRCRMSDLFFERLENDYAKLELRCDIKRDTFQKMLRFRNGRGITYKNLSKFCIGTGLSIEETRELFKLIGHDLSERSRADYILLCELYRKGDISDFAESMEKYCGEKILSNADA